MVAPDRITARLRRLAELTSQLDGTRVAGFDAYRSSDVMRAATERRLQLAIQICIDIGAHVLAERNVAGAEDYADVFRRLQGQGIINRDLADRLASATRQRNLMVHLYLEIDDAKIFDSLDRLDDLVQFATAVQRLLDAESE